MISSSPIVSSVILMTFYCLHRPTDYRLSCSESARYPVCASLFRCSASLFDMLPRDSLHTGEMVDRIKVACIMSIGASIEFAWALVTKVIPFISPHMRLFCLFMRVCFYTISSGSWTSLIDMSPDSWSFREVSKSVESIVLFNWCGLASPSCVGVPGQTISGWWKPHRTYRGMVIFFCIHREWGCKGTRWIIVIRDVVKFLVGIPKCSRQLPALPWQNLSIVLTVLNYIFFLSFHRIHNLTEFPMNQLQYLLCKNDLKANWIVPHTLSMSHTWAWSTVRSLHWVHHWSAPSCILTTSWNSSTICHRRHNMPT